MPRRILVVGASDDERVMAAARKLPPDGMMICIDGDRSAAARATTAFARERLPAHVMIGEPALFTRKVSGPFDLILTLDDYAVRLAADLSARLAPEGRIQEL